MRLDKLNESFANKYNILDEAEETPWYGDDLDILDKDKFEVLLSQAGEKLDNDFDNMISEGIWDTDIKIAPGTDPDYAHDDPYGSDPEVERASFNFDNFVDVEFAKFIDSLLDDPDVFSHDQQERIKNNIDGERDYLRGIFNDLLPMTEDTFWEKVLKRYQEIEDDIEYYSQDYPEYDKYLEEGLKDTVKAIFTKITDKSTQADYLNKLSDKLYTKGNNDAAYKLKQKAVNLKKAAYDQWVDEEPDIDKKIAKRNAGEKTLKKLNQQISNQYKQHEKQSDAKLKYAIGFDNPTGGEYIGNYVDAGKKALAKCKSYADAKKVYTDYINEINRLTKNKVNETNSLLYKDFANFYRKTANALYNKIKYPHLTK